MNKQLRKQLLDIINNLNNNIDNLESIRDDIEYKKEIMPENLQNSKRADDYDNQIEFLNDILENFRDLVSEWGNVERRW